MTNDCLLFKNQIIDMIERDKESESENDRERVKDGMRETKRREKERELIILLIQSIE